MIYFYDDLVAKTLDTIKSAYDCADVSFDLMRINETMKNVEQGNWQAGVALDQEMRLKYPYINKMDQYSRTFSNPMIQPQHQTRCSIVFSNLNEDYYGVLCETAIKKGIVSCLEEFIKR